MNGLIILGLSFTVFSLVLAWVLFSTPGKLKTKLTLSIVFVYLSTALAFSFTTFMGFPTDEGIPEGSVFQSAVIRLPQGADKGAIFVWAIAPETNLQSIIRPFVFQNTTKAPRAFYIPYSDEAQKAVENASESSAKGMRVIFGPKKTKKEGKNDSKQAARYEEDGDLPEIKVIDPREGMKGKLDH